MTSSNLIQSLSTIFSQEILDAIEKLASLYLPISDIAVTLDIPEPQLRAAISDPTSEARHRYVKGKAATKLELRKQEIMLAKVGSPLALENCRHALLDMEDDE